MRRTGLNWLTSAGALALGLVIVGLSACGGTAKSNSSPVTSVQARSSVSAGHSSSAGKTATVAQIAAIVTRDKLAIDGVATSIAGCLAAYDPRNVKCVRALFSGYFAAVDQLAADLSGATVPWGPNYLGAAPPELSSLMRSTVTTIGQLEGQQGRLLGDCTPDPKAARCTDRNASWVSSQKELMGELALWTPYLK